MTEKFDNVSVVAKANVYFEGKCISHSLVLPDGTKKSVGVIQPSLLTFNTGAAEIMETVAGKCRYKLKDADWADCGPGHSFDVPANSSFQIEVSGEPYHYICHFA